MLNLAEQLFFPHLYYDFLSPGDVIGGGVVRTYTPESIYWSIGHSVHSQQRVNSYNLPIVPSAKLLGHRDIDSGCRWLPCVTCKHPIVDIAPGEDTSMILSHWDTVGARTKYNTLMEPIESFIPLFTRTRKVVTNSYHVAYWSLLSGREVRLYGYSSKFYSLYKGFGLSTSNIVHYEYGNTSDFLDKLSIKPKWVSIDADRYKNEFREMNDTFALEVKRLLKDMQ